MSNPLYTPKPQFSSGRGGRGTHTTVVATQVTIEIRVEPNPRPHRPSVFGRHRNTPTAENPACTAFFDSSFQQWVPGEPAPRFQLRSNALFVTDYRDQIARPAAAQHRDQLRQEARCESLSPDIEIDVSLHRIGAFYSSDSMKADIDLDIGRKTFASGLLPELIAVLSRSRPGDLVAVIGNEQSIGPELETWCRFTGNPLLEARVEEGRTRWVFRRGRVAMPAEDTR